MRIRCTPAVALAFAIGLLLPVEGHATHPGAGNCKHTGHPGFTICTPSSIRKIKCTTSSGATGKCKQYAVGCFCVASTALDADAAVSDLRDAFDIVLLSADLPASGVSSVLACQQVQTLTTHMAKAVAPLNAFAADVSFAGQELLLRLDSLLKDFPQVDAVATSCAQTMPAGLQAALIAAKTSYLTIYATLP